MSEQKSVAIIGGGASGLLSSILCALYGTKLKVTLFEQNSKCGKKILVSGNGKCNITNANASYKNYHNYQSNTKFVKQALKEFGFNEFKDFVSKIGLLLNTKEDGKTYPISLEAKNVVSILTNYAISLGVEIKLKHKVSSVKNLFNKQKYNFVIVATGSNSAVHLGGCDDGYKFAKEFNHTIKPTYPALVQLHSPSKIIKKLSGTKIYSNITLIIDNKNIQTISGDVLFTNYGLSGLSILDISQKASFALHSKYNKKIEILIDLLPYHKIKKLNEHIKNIANNQKDFLILDILYGLIANKIANGVLEFLNINKETKAYKLKDNEIAKIVQTLKAWKFEINDTHGFRHCEVSGGGVNIDEIYNKTMQSKKKENLYFCGEVLDVVGDRGGYNFAFAWGSAYLASMDIIKKTNL
jgi:predicted Rossmann fold flavoprotein